jgi:hypothetical protein
MLRPFIIFLFLLSTRTACIVRRPGATKRKVEEASQCVSEMVVSARLECFVVKMVLSAWLECVVVNMLVSAWPDCVVVKMVGFSIAEGLIVKIVNDVLWSTCWF